MIYLKAVLTGIGGSLTLLIVFVIVMTFLHRGEAGMVGVNIVSRLPLTVAAVGFAIGFLLVFRTSG